MGLFQQINLFNYQIKILIKKKFYIENTRVFKENFKILKACLKICFLKAKLKFEYKIK